MTIAGNFENYLTFEPNPAVEGGDKFQYKFSYFPVAVAVIYGIGFGLPLAIKLIMKFFGTGMFDSSYIEVMGIYCYSFSSFLISCLLSAIPISILQWIMMGYSMVVSTLFLVITYWNDLAKNLNGRARIGVIAFVAGVQISLLLVFRLYFFKHT